MTELIRLQSGEAQVARKALERTISADDRESAEAIIERLDQAALASRPPEATDPAPSDGGGEPSDGGGAGASEPSDGGGLSERPERTATPPDEGEDS